MRAPCCVFRCVERHVARALSAGKGTDWPTVAIVARRLRMSHGAVEASGDASSTIVTMRGRQS